VSVELLPVATFGISEYVEPSILLVDAERQECEWLLTSGVLGRSSNLARVLRYLCEEYFQGRADQIKEYTIAIEALGRRESFDPQTDTIVRVTVHALRKRLMDIYQNEGAGRPVTLVIPAGHYVPSFVHHPSAAKHQVANSLENGTEHSPAISQVVPLPKGVAPRALPVWLWYVAGLLLAAGSLTAWLWSREFRKQHAAVTAVASVALPAPAPQATIRALMGSGRAPYVDHSGNVWAAGNYCQGGTSVTVPNQRIEGTEETPLYLGGMRGIAFCTFPVTQALYELRFYFAETTDLPMATRTLTLSINSGHPMNIDVVDNAGGNRIATSTIVTGVAPEHDGAIHVDFTSDVSLMNAVEILPTPSENQLPVRIVANSNAFVDSAKQVWESDRYFIGGRRGRPPADVANISSLGIYQSDRIGRFRYNIPAVPKGRYRVKLYFREPWFGKQNGVIGGPGSRVFDVACNGVLLMKDFDILANGNTNPIVKTFDNVQASADGRIELYFMPVVNYPLVNAIEVLPEGQ